MFKDEREQNRFALALVIAWLIHFVLSLFLFALSAVAFLNYIYAIGGGRWAPVSDSFSSFFAAAARHAPIAAIFALIAATASLLLARWLAAKWPRCHYAAYASAGVGVPLVIGLITLSFNLIGAIIGAVAIWPAARLLRPRPHITADL